MSSDPIAFLLRHGDTKYADDGIIISRTDLLPNAEADEQMEKQFEFLRKYDIVRVYSSPLVRCVIPATRFFGEKQVLQNRGLLPWDRGVLTGVLADEAKPLMELLVKNPNVRIPHGESRVGAEERIETFFIPALDEAEKKPVTAFFTHHTVIDLLNGIMRGDRTSDPENVVEVGGIAAIYVDGDGYSMEAVMNPADASLVTS